MTRTQPPASSDAVTVQAANGGLTHGRRLALREQNTMLALGLVRAALAALQGASRTLERAGHVVARNHGTLDAKDAPELGQLFDELAQQTRAANHEGHLLLDGGNVAYALTDPWLEQSELTHVELPALAESVLADNGLEALELSTRTSVLTILQHMHRVRTSIQEGNGLLQRAANQLNVVLQRLHADRNDGTPHKREDDFEHWVEKVRDRVLATGTLALSVQGTPTTRAASLVEGTADQL